MSRFAGLSTPVSERMKLFDKDSTPKKIPTKCSEKPVKESSKGLDTPKLRPVPRSQFTIKEPPPGVKAYLNPKLSSPVTKSQEAQKTDLKASKSESPSSSSNVSKTDQTRAARVRSTSTARPAAGASKASTPEKSSSPRAVTNKKAATPVTSKKTPGEPSAVVRTPSVSRAPMVSRSGSMRTPSVTRTPSMTRKTPGETSLVRTPSVSRGEAGASGLPVTRARAPSVTRTESVTSVTGRTRAPSGTKTDSAQSVTSRTRTPSVTRTPSMSSTSSMSSTRGTSRALTSRSSSRNVLETSGKKSAEKRQDKTETVGASPGPVTTGESPSPDGPPGPQTADNNTTDDKNLVAISSTPVKSPDTTQITTAEIVPTPVSDEGGSLSLFSTEKTIEFERKTFSSSRKVSNNVTETMVAEVQRSVSDTQVVDEVEVKDCGDEEYKAEAVMFRKDSADRKESVGDIIRKISELNEVIVKEDSSIVEAEDDDLEKSVAKVAEENNDSIVKSDDDNDDDDEDIDNDSVEDDDVQIIQTTQYANKSRKESATGLLENAVKSDTSPNNSNRKFSQKFINPFEPPVPELVNKTALIAEFNSVQEENLKNIGFKALTDEGLDGSKEQYFTSQALNNATSTTINQALKLDIEFRDDKIAGSGLETGSDTETGGCGDPGLQRKLKLDLDTRVRDQEDEVDDLVSQVHMLETSKMRLEMEMQQIKKDFRREIQMKEDDIEDIRMNNNKRVKALEAQLETEHEERMGFLREKHDLESKVMNLQDLLERSGDEDLVVKLKRDLKRTKALLKDAQLYMEKNQNDGTNKVIVRQLKNQLEDAEFARSAAIKAKQNSELELADVQIQLDDVMRCKHETEERNLRLTREKADLTSSLAENEEELQEVMRRYKACVGAVSTDQITIQDQSLTIQTLECERNKLREQYAELCQRLDHMEGENVSTVQHKRLELKIRELESKLELERTTKTRMDTQIMRQKELIEKINREMDDLRLREGSSQEEVKKVSRQLRDLREDLASVQSRELELSHKKSDLEKQLELAEAETLTVKNELKIALRRIDDLQAAIGGEMDSDFVSDQESDSSDEDMSSFIDNHRRSMSIQRERESILRRRDKPFECISEED